MRPPVPAPLRPRVLLVEPDEPTRVAVTTRFVADGYDVHAVPNYAQAIVAVRQQPPEVIVTEIGIGQVMTPERYVAALRRHCPAPIILHTDNPPALSEAARWEVWRTVPKGAASVDGLLGQVADALEAPPASR